MFGLRYIIWFVIIVALSTGAGLFLFSGIASQEKVVDADYSGEAPQVIESRPTLIEQDQMALVQSIDRQIETNNPDQTNADLYRVDGCGDLSKADCVSY